MRVTTFCYNSFTTKQKTKGAVTLMSIVTLFPTDTEFTLSNGNFKIE